MIIELNYDDVELVNGAGDDKKSGGADVKVNVNIDVASAVEFVTGFVAGMVGTWTDGK